MMLEMLETMMIEIWHATRARKQCDEEEDDDGDGKDMHLI
jgi:hypothetical protein